MPIDDPTEAGTEADGKSAARANRKQPAATKAAGAAKKRAAPKAGKARGKKQVEIVPADAVQSPRFFVSEEAALLAGRKRAESGIEVHATEVKPGYWKWWFASPRAGAAAS